jgi:hypothetical protein
MLKRLSITLVVFLAFGALIFGVGALVAPGSVALPAVIVADTPCPVAGCTRTDGACHAAAPAPVPDGSFTMACPKFTGCFDTVCHAQDRLTTHYNRPLDASLNLWILAPVLLIVGLVLIVQKLR